MRFLWVNLLFFICSLAVAQDDAHRLEFQKRKIFPQIQQSPAGQNFDVRHYRFQIYIDPRVKAIKGSVRTTFTITSDTASFLLLDFFNGLQIDSVIFKGQRRNYYFPGNQLFKINLGQVLVQGAIDSVRVFYHGVPANTGFGSFNKSTHAGVPIIWTMSCPYGSRDWWPGKQDLTDKADSIDLIITTPIPFRAAGNGILVSEIQHDTLVSYFWKHKYPIASYLIATAVTNYQAYTQKVHLPSQAPGDSLPLVNFVFPESGTSAPSSTQKVLDIISFYDSLLGPYPFRKEKYGHAQFGWGGGMEHQTMSFMTDFSFGLQAHELAHQWFGNYVTCRSWQDAWLNEGFATYFAALAEKRFGVTNLYNWLGTNQISVRSVSGGSVLVSDTNNINRIFDSRLTYKKGALLLHMLRWQLGEAAFWTGIRNYLNDQELAYGFSRTSQLVRHLEQASGQNLEVFMNQWFKGQGYPTYQLNLNTTGPLNQLTIGQTQSHSSVPFFKMRLPVRFWGNGGDTILIFDHDSSGQVFHFTLSFIPTNIAFDPERWILAKNTISINTEVLPRLPSENSIEVWPNPFQNILNFSVSHSEPFQISIFNSLGVKVMSNQLFSQNSLSGLDSLDPGVYVIHFSDKNGEWRQKVVKR